VNLDFTNINVSFSNVITSGNTTVNTSGAVPAGVSDPGTMFTPIGSYYTIDTTAVFEGFVNIGLTYTGLVPGGYSASDVRLYHYNTHGQIILQQEIQAKYTEILLAFQLLFWVYRQDLAFSKMLRHKQT